MSRELIKPLPTQAVALACPAQELLFGGAKGGGKSHFLTLCALPLFEHAHKRYIETGQKQRHARVVLFRKNLNDLKDLIVKTQRVFPVFDSGAEWNRVEKIWSFSSGATLQVAHLDGPDDHLGWHGQELIMTLWDQVEQISYDQYSFVNANVRCSDPAYKPFLKIRATANPGGEHGHWVKARFYDPCPEGGKIITDEVEVSGGKRLKVTRAFIRSALKDNPYLFEDGQYEANLRASLPPHMVKMYLEGDWNVVTGAFFAHLIRPEVHFIPSFSIPSNFEIRAGLDWGSAAPAAFIVGARDDDGDVYIIDELYRPGETGRVFGERMARKLTAQEWSTEKKWGMGDFYIAFDSQAAAKTGAEGAVPAAGIASWGFRLFPAHKDRKAGIEQVKERLRVRANGRPKIFVFKDRCPNLVRQLESAPTDKKDIEDYERHAEVHAIDALRFLCMEWELPLQERDPKQEELDRWERMIRKQRAENLNDNEMTAGD